MANTKKTTTTTDKLAELGKGKKTVDDYLAERSQRLNGDKASTSSTTGGRGTSTPGKTTTTTDKLAELGKGRKTVNDYLEDYNRRQEKQFAQRNAAAQVNYYGATSAVHGLRNLYDSYSRQAAQEKAGNEQYKNGVMSMYSAVKNLVDKAEAEKTVEKTTINPPRPMEHEGTMPIARGNQILGSVSADQVSLPELAGTPITNRGRSAAAVETDAMAKLAEETARMERIREYQGIPQRDDFDYERYQMGYIPPNGDQVLRAMSDEEKAVYRYIRINYGDKEAEEYYQYMKPIVESRRLEAASGELVKVGEEHPVAASVLSTMFSTTNALTGGAKLLYDAYKNVTDPGYTIDPYDQMNGAAFIRDKLREGTMTNMPEWGKFLYQTGMSIADTSANAFLFGGTGGAIALGTGAAADTAREVKMRGGTDEQALGMGVIAGAAELLTEKMGFDRLGDLIGGKKGNVFRAVLGHMTSEFGEEAGTEVANLFADWAVMQDKSQYNQLVMEHGVKGAWWEMLKQVGLAGAGGALSGGVMGGGSAALGKAFQSMQNRETRTATQDAIRELAEKAAEAEAVVPQTDVAGLAMQTAENEAQSGAVAAQESMEAQVQNVPGRAAETATQAQAGAQNTQGAAQDVQRAQYMESAQEAGKKYGDRAALVFAQNYTGGDVKQYDAAFNALYSAGKVGLKLSDIGKVTDALTAGLSEATKQSIWQAGANSRMTEVIPGVQKMYTQKATDTQKRQIAILNEIGRRYGVEIDIVDSIDSGLANGAYSGGRKIVVALDAAEGAIAQTGVHELVHYLKRTDSSSYEVFRDAVMEHLTNSGKFDLEQAIADRGRQYAGRNMTREDLIEEIVAEAAPTFLTDRQAMEEFVNRSPRSLIEKIRDFFLNFVDEIRAIAERYANRAGSERQEIKALLGMSDELTDIARFFDAALETASMGQEAEAGETVFARGAKPMLTDEEYASFYEKIAEMKIGKKAQFHQTEEGWYIFDIGNKLVYTDGNWDYPGIVQVVTFKYRDQTRNDAAKTTYVDCEDGGLRYGQIRDILERLYKTAAVSIRLGTNGGRTWGQNGRGTGSDSGTTDQGNRGDKTASKTSYSLTPAQTRLVESNQPVDGEVEASKLPDQTSFSLNRPIERKGDLVAVHNLDVESLLKVIRINGFTAPSIAVTKTGLTTLKFGSVTIVFDKNVVDPKADARNRLYARDAYTPVAGHARDVYVVNAGAINQLRDQLEQHMDFLPDNLRRSLTKYLDDVSSGNLRFDSAEELVQDAMRRKAMKAAYLVSAAPKLYDLDRENASFEFFSPGKAQEKMDRWIDDTIAKEDGYEDWVKSVMGNVYGGKRVGVGGSSAEPTAENIVKSMYENAREKANTPARNAHALSYALAQAYDSIKAAKKDMRLLGNDEARYAKLDDADQALEGWIANVEQVNGKSGAYDVLREAAYNGAKTAGDIRKAFAEAGWTIDRAAARTAADIFARINSIATPYFEAKPGYAVGLDSVKAVLIPDNVDMAALEEIRAAFGNVIVYPAGNNDARLDALNGLNGVKFSLNNTSPASTITDENQNLSLPVDVKVNVESIRAQAQAAMEAGLTERMQLQIKGVANKIMNETGSEYSKDDFIGNMTKLIEQYARSGWTEDTLRAVTEMSRKIIEQSRRADTTLRDQYSDLRKRLRETGIAFTETQKQEAANIAGSYGEYRKGLMGSVKLAENGMTLEAMWDELSTEYPELFAPGTNEGDMVQKLQDFTHLMQPRYENPYGMDMDGAALEMAMRIEGDIMGIIGVKDAAKAMYGSAEKLRARFEQEFKEKLRQQKAERVQKFQQIAADLKAAKAAGDSAAQSRAMSQYRAAMKATGLEDAYAEIRATLKARQEAKAETAERNKVIGRISKQASELMGMFTHPKKGKRIPTALQDTVLKVLEALDINGEKAASEGRDTIKAKEFREKLTGIREFYETVVNGQSAGTAPEIMEGLMMTVSERNVEMINEALDVLSKGDRFVLREMNSDQLKSLSELMKNIKHTAESVGKLWRIQRYQGVVELGDASIEEMDKRGPEKLEKISKQGIREGAKGARDFFVLGMMEPVSYGERLGEGGSAIIQGLMDGEKEKFGKVRAASDAMGRMMKDVGISGYDIGKWMQNVQTVKFANGTQVKMTDAMIMSLYLTAQRPQGIRHLLGTGFTIREGERVSSHVDNISLVQDDLNMVAGLLTDKQRRLADAMQAYLSTDVAKWGNDVTQRLYLYDAFTEGKYWPLISDPKQINTEEPEGDRAFMAIVNAGFTKPLNENANNAVIIQDAFKVFERHISEMASYAGYAEVMTDTMAWLNYRQRDENGLTGKDIKGSMAKLLGEGGQKYLTKLIQDINGARMGGDVFDFGGGWLNKLTGKAKAAAVAGKIRVAMQQPTSIVRAAAEINPIYLLRAMKPTRGSVREMQKWSNLAWWKANGNYDIGVGKSMNKILFGDTRVLDTTKEVAGKVAALGLDPGKADDLTWSRIWEAAKLEIKRKRKDLKVGSDEYFRAVTERFEAICDRTQVVDTVMHRSDVMRNKDGMAKNLTAFMGEPIKSYNMLMRSTLDVLRDPKNAKVYGKLVRTGMAYVASVAATTAATALFDALKYRDDDDPLWEYLLNGGLAEDWTQQFLKSFWGNLNPASNIVLIKDIIDMLNGGEAPSVFAFEIFRDISDAFEIVKDYVFGENKKKLTRYGAIKPVANMIGTLSGYPVNGLLANAEMLAHAYDPKLLQTKSDMQTMDAAYDKLYQAMAAGDKKGAEAVRAELTKGMYGNQPKSTKEIDKGVAEALALNDDRILTMWQMSQNRQYSDYVKTRKEIQKGGFSEEQVVTAVNRVQSLMNARYNELLDDGKTADAEALLNKLNGYGMTLEKKVVEKDMNEELEAKSLTYNDLYATISNGDMDDIAVAVEMMAADSDAADPEAAMRDKVSGKFRGEYVDMVRSGKTKDAGKLAEKLELFGIDEEKRSEWVETSYRDDLRDAVKNSRPEDAADMVGVLRDEYGLSDEQIYDAISKAAKDTYMELLDKGDRAGASALEDMLNELELRNSKGNYFNGAKFRNWETDWEKAQEEEE